MLTAGEDKIVRIRLLHGVENSGLVYKKMIKAREKNSQVNESDRQNDRLRL